jgi:glycosyltransferase involved in cell wall biosynthesis
MSVSVAMCTYNGSRFLLEQLTSIANQTKSVDELVICDDCSTDDTIEIIKQFAKKVAFSVRIFVNATNLGSNRNFEKCLSLCQNDIIILSDQDDVWLPHKVEKICAYFTKNQDIEAVFSDAQVIDDQSKLTGRTAWETVSFDYKAQNLWKNGQAFDILLRGYVVTGATLAIRKRILPEVLPIPMLIKELIHDGWIALWLSINNRIAMLDEPLVHYRQHTSQQVGFGTQSGPVSLQDRLVRPRSIKLAPILKKYNDSKSLYEYLSKREAVPAHYLALLASRQAHYQMRSTLPNNHLRRLFPVLKNYTQYQKHDAGHWWKTMLGDIFE